MAYEAVTDEFENSSHREETLSYGQYVAELGLIIRKLESRVNSRGGWPRRSWWDGEVQAALKARRIANRQHRRTAKLSDDTACQAAWENYLQAKHKMQTVTQRKIAEAERRSLLALRKEDHLCTASRRAGSVLRRRGLWGFNRYIMVCELWKAVHVPALTFANAIICMSSPTREWLERGQRVVGCLGTGCHGNVANEAIQGDLGWSSFEAREANSKISYDGRLRAMGKHRWARRVFDYITVNGLRTRWMKRLQQLRRKFGVFLLPYASGKRPDVGQGEDATLSHTLGFRSADATSGNGDEVLLAAVMVMQRRLSDWWTLVCR
ncbi:hypothetical protein HPB49_018307 [Dermacentor silvarum]|uniref:Uncharacterized protein n=1 Tax=Dermacentor silvarum TaxID=543639 RepID=A0ACB8E276_DERSI|nr:hypothetical protein HPB49_018307 [Dermacentor silvarum]